MVIIGAGECGARAAFGLRENGYGGPVILIGEEPHGPYERPPLSKAMLLDHTVGPSWTAAEERYAEAGITHLRGVRVTAIDRAAQTVTLSDGAALDYDRLLLATGAVSRRLRIGDGDAHIVHLRSLDDALQLRPRLVSGMRLIIVGAGFIGMELAASARTLGLAVTIIETQPRILMRGVPQEIAAIIARRHADEGVRVLTGAGIADAVASADGVSLHLADGARIEADILVGAIGSLPVTGLAETAGLAVADGILVDAQLQSSDPAIFAAGDCCRFPLAIYGGRTVRLESWRNAHELGTLAARNMLGHSEPVALVPWFWSDQYDLTLQVAGLADEGVLEVRRELGDGALILFHLAADGRLVAASGIGTGNAVARDIKLAEMLIAKGAKPDAALLSRPEVRLKSLLTA